MAFGELQRGILAAFQNENPEKFNEEVIFMRQNEKDGLHSYFQDLFKSLKLNGIEYLGSETITDESEFHKYVPRKSIAIEESRLDLIKATFKLSIEEEGVLLVKEVSIHLFFPKLIDDFFFYLNGSKYFAVYQLTDRNFYSSRTALYLKTLLMPLGLHQKPSKMKLTDGEIISGNELLLDYFKQKSNNFKNYKNMFTHYFITMGIDETIDYFFKVSKGVKHPQTHYMYIVDDLDDVPAGYKVMDIRKDLWLAFHLDSNSTPEYRDLIITFGLCVKGVRKTSSLYEEDYWKRKIITSTNGNLSKADKAIISFERVLDERTKRNLKEVPDTDKDDVYGIIKFMAFNYSMLYNIDSVNVYNRRLRLYEYMLYPLLIKFSEATYRVLNSRNVNMKRLENVFSNIGPNFLIKKIITSDLCRYNNASSTLDFFQTLKWSARGPQALGSSGQNITMRFRGVHESYVGNLGMVTANASDPGMTGTLCPMSGNIQNMLFEDPKRKVKYNIKIDNIA